LTQIELGSYICGKGLLGLKAESAATAAPSGTGPYEPERLSRDALPFDFLRA